MIPINPIYISNYGSFSPLGWDKDAIFSNYKSNNHFFHKNEGNWDSSIKLSNEEIIKSFHKQNINYKNIDRSVLLAIKSAEIAINKLGWNVNESIGINIGSSRGATHLWEKYITAFNKNNKVSPQTSPLTSLGNISSWVANHLGIQGPCFSHSMTCSSSFYALLNGIAWLNGGMIDKMIVGGSEAAITPFTISQFKSLRIYSQLEDKYPCQAGNFHSKSNSMVLGEGSMILGLEKKNTKNSIQIKGIGYSSEFIDHSVSLSKEANNCQNAMKMAISEFDYKEIDIIITHTPGTINGDLAEYNAITKVFGKNIPLLTNNKWKMGHTFGASGVLSLEMAILILNNQQFISTFDNDNPKINIKNILINVMGFGGNAVSILVGI